MSKEQSNGDLLPYREVDRALKPKLPLLAGLMGVSTQHALGSLLEFWDLCADRRELERIAAQAMEQAWWSMTPSASPGATTGAWSSTHSPAGVSLALVSVEDLKAIEPRERPDTARPREQLELVDAGGGE